MKTLSKKLCFILLVLFAYNQAMGQTAFGLKGGLNLSSIDLQDAEATYNSRTGYHAGVFLRGKFDKVAIQPELLLFTQSGEIQSSIIGTAQESFTYLAIPVLLKFYPLGGLNIQAGPQFGFLLDGERKGEVLGIGNYTQDITEHYKNSDVIVSLGAGYDFGFGLNLDVRYNIGVKDINNATQGEEARSRVFMISLGWNFLK
ncbi:MAG TPA: porin family protein [Cyclobacteriaceae bacterium]|nr:porin family protein [Cyclobacteriaceae bacterium]